MKLIKNGKLVLNGTRTEEETEELLFKALEIIVDKDVDVPWLKICKNIEEYNEFKNEWEKELTQEEYEILKEIL